MVICIIKNYLNIYFKYNKIFLIKYFLLIIHFFKNIIFSYSPMADRVHQNFEKMTIELEEYNTLNIFTENELQQIIQKRQSFEYQIHRMQKNENDFTRYIDYETRLQKILQKRLGDKITTKIMSFTKNKIFNLYTHLLHHFPKFPYYKKFVDFAVSNEFNITRIITEYCIRFPRDIDNWIYSTEKLQYIDTQSTRTLLQRAIRINKKEKRLYEHFIEIELNLIEDELKESEEEYNLALIIYNECKDNCNGKIEIKNIDFFPLFKKIIEK
ncbi:hypothetical protein SLOPH_1740 [Spraguea lophii 42_110]|uniref:U3 small nucleolar RNA-associated protein 6 N-terminal domain-containing protein n=1 Tax=Spraguea lophii (strain 42_110) TaxID=1358809 RepID=S7XG61_SPRLO|nr:hypothetical protein SLOPH_1740 [Spraguea lophii 42_110]